MERVPGCPLCEGEGGLPVVRAGRLRVIRAEEAGFPVFYRVVWNAHRPEFSSLDAADRAFCMDAVAAVEQAVRDTLVPSPDKMNLAAFGNQVPHLHWHVIARYRWDSHFPASTWATAARPADPDRLAALAAALPAVDAAVARAVSALA